jgi:hypothetical protein
MIKNKIIALFSLLMLTGTLAVSQTSFTTFGLRAGLDFQNINGKDFNGNNLDLSLVPRFNVGAHVNVPVAPEFYFQSGLLFTTKGAKDEGQFMGLDFSAEYNLSYLELPLNLLYKPVLGSGYLLLGFGPYLGYGVGGKATYSAENVSIEEDITFTSDYEGEWEPSYFKPFDFGGNLFFGYELFNGLSFQVNTQLGLMNIKSENTTIDGDETVFKNTGFGISLGYSF